MAAVRGGAQSKRAVRCTRMGGSEELCPVGVGGCGSGEVWKLGRPRASRASGFFRSLQPTEGPLMVSALSLGVRDFRIKRVSIRGGWGG